MESRLRQRTEGRLDRSRDPVILDAALAVVSENGYDAASMNDIAARAGVGKAAIYRRWSSKAALITDALIYWRPDLLTREVPDTGSLVGDLDALIEQIGRADQDPVPNDLVLRVALEAAHEPGLAAAVDDLVLVKGKGLVAKILAQAAARGEIDAQRDWSMVADVVLAMGLLQVVRGQTLDAAFVRNVIDALVLPALRGPFTA
ncbi:TetR/AcrR family transcriptional regulator [Mycolicibacter arupensis]|jgi:AcrR family transcriptional regulator|uniref:TetR/AcrR family transcriptional regulator n=1 Tax=Mycolicibacter arupensis TaxID=342002 RepID=A0A5C7XR74_9MYCO|nr:TetR/AcrR family transcriptional regulator [Mycolicibacter arupensis]TXI52027.1 MAG: TetR/AcrR family transcriptional regulator [Mycolicibacter arupensis]